MPIQVQQTIARTAVLAALFLPAVAQAGYAECLLKRLPGVQNDVAANAIMQTCQMENPGGIQAVAQGSGRGWFSHKSGAECTAKTAADTRSNRAAALIRQACMRLYDEPRDLFDELGIDPNKPPRP